MRNWVNSPSAYRFGFGLYKAIAIRGSDLIARLLGTRAKSWSVVVFENGIVREMNS